MNNTTRIRGGTDAFDQSDRLDGHVAVVTGGNGGIGLGMARGLARAGADLAIWGRNPDKNARAAGEIEALGATVHSQQCDVSDEGQVEEAMAETLRVLGRVDSLTSGAGISGRAPLITDTSLEEWRHVLATNLDGTFLCLRAAARQMVEQGAGGSLIVISSTSALHGAPGFPHYATSKTGLLGLTRSLAVQLARYRIRVNALLPGWTNTEMLSEAATSQKFIDATVRRTPVRRWAEPDEFGPAAVWLADPTHTFHTGDTVVMDGGYTIF